MPYQSRVSFEGPRLLAAGWSQANDSLGQGLDLMRRNATEAKSLRSLLGTYDPENKDKYHSMGLAELRGSAQAVALNRQKQMEDAQLREMAARGDYYTQMGQWRNAEANRMQSLANGQPVPDPDAQFMQSAFAPDGNDGLNPPVGIAAPGYEAENPDPNDRILRAIQANPASPLAQKLGMNLLLNQSAPSKTSIAPAITTLEDGTRVLTNPATGRSTVIPRAADNGAVAQQLKDEKGNVIPGWYTYQGKPFSSRVGANPFAGLMGDPTTAAAGAGNADTGNVKALVRRNPDGTLSISSPTP